MSIASLIQEFDNRKVVPVELSDIEAALAERGVKDEIFWFPVDIDAEVLRGQLVQWDIEADYEYPTTWKQDEVRKVAAIYYASGMSDDWQRLVGCKELLHIMDSEHACACTPDVVQKLTEKIVLAPELQDAMVDGIHANTDRIAILQAVAVLFPWRARELFVANDGLSISEIARLVDLPQRYVALVMSELWPDMHEILRTL